ncbi:MAG: outer membrane protein assembly factor BamB family protein [Planctomycetota bacterium]|jgi:outer membrane protein assembly factor BamB
MSKQLPFKLFIVASLFILRGPGTCLCQEGASVWLVSPRLLEHAKLRIVWAQKLPMQKNESLERLSMLGNRIYALSNQNYMVSLNRENGSFVFGRFLAPAGFGVLGLDLYEDTLISVVGSRLVEINPESGMEIRGQNLGFGASCSAARNSSYFYIAGADRRLRTFRAEDKVKLFEVTADNESLITSVIADDESVVFATDAGNVISIRPDERKRLWQFDAAGSIVGPIVRDGNSILVASKDTYVYKLDMARGTPAIWKYQAGAILDRAPVVTRDVVYQYVPNKGLTAIDNESGRFMWQVDHGLDLLAEKEGRAYVFREPGELVVMDNKKKKRLYSVNFAGVTKYAGNVADSKIYVADKTGRMVCLRPVD